MAYRADVTDNQQTQVEDAANDSAIRLSWFDGKAVQTGRTKFVRAFDMQAQGNTGSQVTSAKNLVTRRGESTGVAAVVGSHNDNQSRFDTPGKA